MNRRAFLEKLASAALVSTIPSHLLAAGSPYSTDSEKTAFQDACLRRIEGLENYIQSEIPNFSSQISDLEDNYGFPKELIYAIISVEGGTPWLGASRTTPYFQDTVGTGWSNGALRAAAGLPQIFDAAYQEAIDNSRGENSLIRNSDISRAQMIQSERLPDDTPTVPYQKELIPAYLTRLRNWIQPSGSSAEDLVVLSQAYNSGVGGIFDNGGRSQTGNLAQRLIENPASIIYPNAGVDRRYAQKVYDVMNRI